MYVTYVPIFEGSNKCRRCCLSPNNNKVTNNRDPSSSNLINLTKRIDQKILSNNWNRSGMQWQSTSKPSGMDSPAHHNNFHGNSMQALLGYNEVQGEWRDWNSTTYRITVVFKKTLIQYQVTIEYTARLRVRAMMLWEESLP